MLRKHTVGPALFLFALVISVGTAEEVSAPTAQRGSHYHYFKEPRGLRLDANRVALLRTEAGAAAAASGDEIRSSGAKVSADSEQPLSVRGWSLLSTTPDGRDGAAVERTVLALAAMPAATFSSPVFFGMNDGPVIVTPNLLVAFQPGVTAARAEAILAEVGAGAVLDRNWANTRGAYRMRTAATDGYAVLDLANALAQRPEVRFAEPDFLFTGRGSFIPNDTLFASVWGIHNVGQDGGTADMDMDGPEAWDVTQGDPSIKVVVMDTGIQQNHPDINQLPGLDVTSEAPGAGGGPVNPCDNHGTAVGGCVSARINNNLGTVGIAPNVKAVSVRFAISTPACNSSWNGQSSWTVDALAFAESIGAKVTNNSNGYDSLQSAAIDSKYEQTRNDGMVHFASAMNDAQPVSGYPASLPSVNSIAALDRTGNRASFSNYGPDIFLSAPGAAVVSTDRTGGDGYNASDYASVNGTSFASPYTAGVAALVLSVNPARPAAAVEAILATTAVELGTGGWDTDFGWGFLNANAAVLAAQDVCDDLGTPDCNGNTVVDTCDIFEGTSTDCNSNDVPDECELDTDCQPNGIRDICEIGQGLSRDCDLDSVPDECQFAFDPDCQFNGILDVCDNLGVGSIVSSRPAVNGYVGISGVGTALSLLEDAVAVVSLPFVSTAFATQSVVISNNGYVGLNGASAFPNPNTALPNFTNGEALLVFWDDFDATSGGVYHHTIGAAPNRTFIVEWSNRAHFPGDAILDGDEATFEVQIFETPVDDIVAQFLYQDVDFDATNFDLGASATIGHQRTPWMATPWSFNSASVAAGTVLSLIRGDTNENARPDVCDIAAPARTAGPDRTRALGVSPVAIMSAMRVTLLDLQNPKPANAPCCPPQNFSAYESGPTCTDAGGCVRWVGAPLAFFEMQSNPLAGSFRGARLQCTPLYHDWASESEFVIIGAEILPSSRYTVHSVGLSCAGNETGCLDTSAELLMTTGRSGDVASVFNPPSSAPQPDALDVVAMVNKFRNVAGAIGKSSAQLQPNVIDPNVDLSALDVVACVDAFRGLAYPQSGPCPCPSTVTCNVTACTGPAQCPGGLCIKICAGGVNASQPCVTDAHCPSSTCGAGACRDRCGRCN